MAHATPDGRLCRTGIFNGEKDIISLSIGEIESAKYWLGVLNELKNRGVQDIMVICADGGEGTNEFGCGVGKMIYTTNAIESVNSTYKKLNRQRSVFPSPTALMKSLYLSTMQITRRWSQPLRNWETVYGEFCIMYGDWMPD